MSHSRKKEADWVDAYYPIAYIVFIECIENLAKILTRKLGGVIL